jgi:hypothetical protein
MNMPKPKFLIYDGFQDDTIVVIFVKELKGSCYWAILPSIMHIVYKGKHIGNLYLKLISSYLSKFLLVGCCQMYMGLKTSLVTRQKQFKLSIIMSFLMQTCMSIALVTIIFLGKSSSFL